MDREFYNRLLATYRIEAAEHLETIGGGLLALLEERGTPEQRREVLRGVYRAFHSLKGAARSVSVAAVEAVCHRCEDLLAGAVDGRVALDENSLALLQRVVAHLNRWHERSPAELSAPVDEEGASLIRLLEDIRPQPSEQSGAPSRQGAPPEDHGTVQPAEPPSRNEPTEAQDAPAESAAMSFAAEQTVRASVSRLDAILYQAEELVALKEEGEHRIGNLRALEARFAEWRREWGRTQSDAGVLRFLVSEARAEADFGFQGALERIYRFLDWNREFVEQLQRDVGGYLKASRTQQLSFGMAVDKLLDETKEILMVPFASGLSGLSMFVAETLRQSPVDKRARLAIEGGEVEVDRRILEAMKDPLIHLVRNAVDHGIESAPERERAGKPPTATIRLSITPLGDGNVEVAVSNDGRGVDLKAVRAKAQASGLIDARSAPDLPREQLLELLFEPQFSTREDVTELSGRGLGLSIVKENAERLGGYAAVSSEPDGETTFRVVVPLTLARFRGLEVEVDGELFILPSSKVRRAGRVREDSIRPVKGVSTIEFEGRAQSLFSLREIFSLPAAREESASEHVSFVIVGDRGREFALGVSEIGDEREVVMKGLGPQLRRVHHIAGATELGDGRIVPVVNLADVALTVAGERPAAAVVGAPRQRARRMSQASQAPRILVVEDSITARSLLKNILESAGYWVTTARDGAEGWTAAQEQHFDAVITDLEMPKMSGFELTRNLRRAEHLANLPIIILTALASAEDKRQGMDAGADAYVVKSSFDQSDLLATLEDLLPND